MGGALSPGQDAVLAQHRAAQRAVEDAWPHNEWLLADERVERAALDLVAQSDDELVMGVRRGGGPSAMGRSYLLWSGVAVAVPPVLDEDSCQMLARRTAPALPTATCDGCGMEGCTAAAVVALSPHLVGLTFCGGCSARLATTDPAGRPLWWALPAPPPEGD